MKLYMVNSKLILVDANIWVAALDKDDTTHQQAHSFLNKIAKDKTLILSALVVQEVMTVYMRKGYFDLAQSFYQFAKTHKAVRIIGADQQWLDATAELLSEVKTRRALSYTDYSLIAMAREFGAELATFDKKLLTAYKQLTS